MTDEQGAFWAGAFIGVISFLAICVIFGATPFHQSNRDRQEAVNNGVAQWVATPKGEMQFVWITNR